MEEKAIVPTKYDDAYAIYSMSGIYPKFTLTLDGVELEIKELITPPMGNPNYGRTSNPH